MQSRVVMFPPSAIVVGQVLGRDVRNAAGTLVAQAGRIVDKSLLRRLRSRGLAEVPVMVAPDAMVPALREALLTATLDHLFRHWRLSPGMCQLRSLLAEYRMGSDC